MGRFALFTIIALLVTSPLYSKEGLRDQMVINHSYVKVGKTYETFSNGLNARYDDLSFGYMVYTMSLAVTMYNNTYDTYQTSNYYIRKGLISFNLHLPASVLQEGISNYMYGAGYGVFEASTGSGYSLQHYSEVHVEYYIKILKVFNLISRLEYSHIQSSSNSFDGIGQNSTLSFSLALAYGGY